MIPTMMPRRESIHESHENGSPEKGARKISTPRRIRRPSRDIDDVRIVSGGDNDDKFAPDLVRTSGKVSCYFFRTSRNDRFVELCELAADDDPPLVRESAYERVEGLQYAVRRLVEDNGSFLRCDFLEKRLAAFFMRKKAKK